MITFSIERSANQDGPWLVVESDLTEQSIALPDQGKRKLWYYRILAFEDGNHVYTTKPISVVTLDVPTIVSATGGVGVTHTSIEWNPTCANKYRVYRRIPFSWSYQILGMVPGETFHDYLVSLHETYEYRITAVTDDGRGETAFSDPAFAGILEGGIFMGSRATVYQGIQAGKETVRGTAVPATHRILGMEINPSPQIPLRSVRYPGSKASTGTQRGQEHTEASYNGVLDYNLIEWILTGLFGEPSMVGGMNTWNPSPVAPVTPVTYTFEHGSVAGAERFAHGMVSDLTLRWSREDASIEGTIFGHNLTRNAVMTPNLPVLAPRPVNPLSIGVWLSTDGGTTFNRILKDLDGEIRMNSVWKPVFHVNDANPTFDDVVELSPDMGVTLTMESGTEEQSFIDDLYEGQLVHLGIKAIGKEYDGGLGNETIRMYLPVNVVGQDPGDKSDVYGNTITFDVAHDEEFGLAQIQVSNELNFAG